jgi:hypothetical protein
MNRLVKVAVIVASTLFLMRCELANPELRDATEGNVTDPEVLLPELLNGSYAGLRDLQPQDNLMALTVHPSDEMAGPTRGADWDDAGVWRVLHTHSWNATHPYVNNVYTILARNSFNAQNVVCGSEPGETNAQGVFLRTLNDYLFLDSFGFFLRRECGSSLLNPPTVVGRAEAINTLIEDLRGVLNNLPTAGSAGVATQNAGRALLMKMLLNRAVYEATGSDGTPTAGPYTHSAADMNEVISLGEQLAGSYSLDENYFDNFAPDNGTASSELIFVSENTDGAASGLVRSRWQMTLHYNQNPSGWNGFVALADLYNLFEDDDTRRRTDLPYFQENGSGLYAGILEGQMVDASGAPLNDRIGNPLVFTPEFDLLESGSSLEVAGLRAIKYIPDFPNDDDLSDNDFIFLRYADVLLMQAEAHLRNGDAGTALGLVNELRTTRGATPLAAIDETEMLNERARELWWEGWRRNDQIRFGTYLGTWQNKESQSEPFRLLFPIPAEALSTNPALVQNPGY